MPHHLEAAVCLKSNLRIWLSRAATAAFHPVSLGFPSPHRMDHGGHPCGPKWHPCCCWHRTFPFWRLKVSPFPAGRLQLHLRGTMDQRWLKSPTQSCEASSWTSFIINVDSFHKRLESDRWCVFKGCRNRNPNTLLCALRWSHNTAYGPKNVSMNQQSTPIETLWNSAVS